MPALAKVCWNWCGGEWAPESQLPSGVQPPEQVPEVVEWNPAVHTQVTVCPALMVVVLVPDVTSWKKSFPMLTWLATGVAVAVRVAVGVRVLVGGTVTVNVAVGPGGVAVSVAVGPGGVGVDVGAPG